MLKFPSNVIFGTSTSAYQIEGAWDEEGKGENIWDRLIHTHPELVRDGTNADTACDSYHKYKEDVQLIKTIGFTAYKFSISWTRVLPLGVVTNINQAGIDYYNNLINELISNNIQPMACLYHFDLPQKLQDIGGWCNPLMVDYFADYARMMYKYFGDRVKWWTTINEPTEVVHGLVDRRYAPYLALECLNGDYIANHNMIKAHARAYRVYEKEFKSLQKGKVSIILAAWFFKPKTDSGADKEAALRAQQFTTGMCAHPIYSATGDYPPVVKKLIDEKSEKEGLIRSKLPRFTEEEINEIKGSYDFMAINHYTTALASDNKTNIKTLWKFRDADVIIEFDKSWPSTAHWSKVVPWGFREVLRWIKQEYDNPPVYITENGFCDRGDIKDIDRINFHKEYLTELLRAIYEHKCNVVGYHVWSLMDNFEWLAGFNSRYGIVYVNHDSPNRERMLKSSALFFRRLCESRSIPQDFDE